MPTKKDMLVYSDELDPIDSLLVAIIGGYQENIKRALEQPTRYDYFLNINTLALGAMSLVEITEGYGLKLWCDYAGINYRKAIQCIERSLGKTLDEVRECFVQSCLSWQTRSPWKKVVEELLGLREEKETTNERS